MRERGREREEGKERERVGNPFWAAPHQQSSFSHFLPWFSLRDIGANTLWFDFFPSTLMLN